MYDLLIMMLILLLVHFVADFPLQGDFLGVYKAKYDFLLFVHCFIWTGCICFALAFFDLFAIHRMVFLFVGHFVIDRWRARHKDKEKYGLTRLLWYDQVLHFGQLVFAVLVY